MFELVEQNIIVLGSINPAIFQPSWLAKIGLIPKGEKVNANFNIGAGYSASFEWENNFSWAVDALSLSVNIPPDAPRDKLTNFIHETFSVLAHTPVTATGHNFKFSGSPDDATIKFLGKDQWGISKRNSWGIITSLKNEITIEESEARRTTIFMGKTYEISTIQVNFHYDAPTPAKVIEYSNDCERNFDTANEILKEVSP